MVIPAVPAVLAAVAFFTTLPVATDPKQAVSMIWENPMFHVGFWLFWTALVLVVVFAVKLNRKEKAVEALQKELMQELNERGLQGDNQV